MFLYTKSTPESPVFKPTYCHCIYWATHLKLGFANLNHTKSGYVWEWQKQSITSPFKLTLFFWVTHNNFVKRRCVVSFVINAILCVKTTIITYNFFNSFCMHRILIDNAVKKQTTQMHRYITTHTGQIATFATAICMTVCYGIRHAADITSTGREIPYVWHKTIVCGFQWLLIIVQNTLCSSMVWWWLLKGQTNKKEMIKMWI